MLIWELAIVAVLILINGFFAMSEIAVVSARRARLQQMAAGGSRGAIKAIRLIDDLTGFLSAVQVGITLVGILAGAYSGATLAGPLADLLRPLPWLSEHAESIAFTLVVVVIAYLSLVAGELVPKRIAMNDPEAIASRVAPAMVLVARIGGPLVGFLRLSTESLLALFGIKAKPDSTVTEEEVKSLIAEGTTAGVFLPQEKAMIEGVLRLADRSVRSIMVPRPDVVWLDAGDAAEALHRDIVGSGHSRFPVCQGAVDEVIGIVHAKDLFDQQHRTGTIDLAAAMRQPLYIDERMPVLKLLERFKASSIHMAIVLDEYGSFEGILTPSDILGAIAGSLPEHPGEDKPSAVQREDGSWLVDGRVPVDDAERILGLTGIAEHGDYATMAGFVLNEVQRIPSVGEHFLWHGWRFEVVDLDGRRIDKILASRLNLDAET